MVNCVIVVRRVESMEANAQPGSPLHDREAAITRIIEVAQDTALAPLVVVTGRAGIGRSTVLAEAWRRLRADDAAIAPAFRVNRNERNRPYAVASRLSAELRVLARTDRHEVRRPPIGLGQQESWPAMAGQLAAALTATVGVHRRLVLFLDDLQWIDTGSLDALVALVRNVAGSSITIVVGVRTPVVRPDMSDPVLAELCEAGLAELIRLRPLHQAAVATLVTKALEATPTSPLSMTLRRTCHGIPALVHAALAGHRRSGSLCVVDRHAYLSDPDRPPELSTDLPMFDDLRLQGDRVWSVAKAMSVLHPLGSSAPRLVAEAVAMSEPDVAEVLESLRAQDVLRHGLRPGQWRFRLPLLAEGLSACLEPYERRRLAQLAVTAIWAGDAHADNRYLAEQLVTAGRFVDPDRAAIELVNRSTEVMQDSGYFAERWLRAATELIADPRRRARALFLHTVVCGIHLRFQPAVDSALLVLSNFAELLPPESLLQLQVTYVIALSGTFDIPALTRVADEDWRTMPGGEGHRLLIRCVALCHLDRVQEANHLLETHQAVWLGSGDAVAAVAEVLTANTAAFLGRMDRFNKLAAEPPQPTMPNIEWNRFNRRTELSRTMMCFGEVVRSNELLTAPGGLTIQRLGPDQAVAAALSGDWDRALDLARVSWATGSALGHVPTYTLMCREASTILIARGRLAQARIMINAVHRKQPILTMLLATPESYLEQVLGNQDRARDIVTTALGTALVNGLAIGTDELWLRLLEFELSEGNREAAQAAIRGLRDVAERIGTGRAHLTLLTGTAMLDNDPAPAAAAVRLARERGRPFELAMTLLMLGYQGLIDGNLLREAYDLFGDLDALLLRTRLRRVMNNRDIAVPGRNVSVAENERLLALLVSEGLTNKELGIALGVSEKSIEGRLTRLFQRTGYRSRVELATAMLTGDYRA